MFNFNGLIRIVLKLTGKITMKFPVFFIIQKNIQEFQKKEIIFQKKCFEKFFTSSITNSVRISVNYF